MSIIAQVEIFLVFGLLTDNGMFTLLYRQGQIRVVMFILYLSTFI